MTKVASQIKLVAILFVVGVALLISLPVHAQSEETVSDSSADFLVVDSTNIDIDIDQESGELIDTSYEGIEVEEITKAPTRFGSFFRNIRERVSIGLTIDPVKKAEKQIKFAEEHIQIAKQLAKIEGNSEKVQDRIAQSVDRAEQLLAKVEEKKEKWLQKKDEQSTRLIENLAKSEQRRERIFNEIESNLPQDKVEQFQESRERMLDKQHDLFENLEDRDLPKQAKERILQAKERLENHQDELQSFLDEKQALIEKAKSGDSVKLGEEIKKLIIERQEERKNIELKIEDRKDKIKEEFFLKKEVINKKAEAGDTTAIEQLKFLQKFEEIKEREEILRNKFEESLLENQDDANGLQVQQQSENDGGFFRQKDVSQDGDRKESEETVERKNPFQALKRIIENKTEDKEVFEQGGAQKEDDRKKIDEVRVQKLPAQATKQAIENKADTAVKFNENRDDIKKKELQQENNFEKNEEGLERKKPLQAIKEMIENKVENNEALKQREIKSEEGSKKIEEVRIQKPSVQVLEQRFENKIEKPKVIRE